MKNSLSYSFGVQGKIGVVSKFSDKLSAYIDYELLLPISENKMPFIFIFMQKVIAR